MPPKKKNTKRQERKELTAEEMMRLGMSQEEIERITSERNKSSDERKIEQEAEALRRKELELKQKMQKELHRKMEEIEKAEVHPRIEILKEEESAWAAMEPGLSHEKNKRLREFNEKEAIRKAEETRKRREEELAAYEARLKSQTLEEREEFITAQVQAEKERTQKALEAEEAKRRKLERKLKRAKERREAARKKNKEADFDEDPNAYMSDDSAVDI